MTLEERLLHAKKKKNVEELEDVFNNIYYEYFGLVGYIISKYVQKKEDVEEIINDCFIKLFNAFLETDITNIKGYLIKIARNETINFIKKRDRNLDIVYNDEYIKAEIVSSSDRGYYELVSEMEKVLNSREINIILLHAVYDYSFKEIADKYHLPISTSSSIYHRALKKFQKAVR